MSSAGPDRQTESPGLDINDVVEKFAALLKSPANGDASNIFALSAEAYLICLTSAVGFYSRAAMSWGAYLGVVGRELATRATSSAEQEYSSRLLLDETIAQLRELGELSVQEARVLQENLAQLATKVRDLDIEKLDIPRRFGKTIP